MSEGDGGESERAADSLVDGSIEISPSRLATAGFLIALLAYVLFLLSRLLAPAEWQFGLEVETEVAAIEFQPESLAQWRVDGATICSLGSFELPAAYRLEDAGAICGGRRWAGWQVGEPEQVINLNGGATAVLEVSDGWLSVSLRTNADSLGEFATVGVIEPVALGGAINLFWNLADMTPTQTFPFTGATTLGRAVSWSDPGLLQSGTVAVYTADESADRRTQLDEAELMLGDQVRLAGVEEHGVWPKGFIRLAEGLLSVVAFGRAESLSIDRYGDSGYDFRPAILTRLASDPLIAFWGSMLIAYMTVVFSLIPFLEEKTVSRDDAAGRPRLLRWFLRYRD